MYQRRYNFFRYHFTLVDKIDGWDTENWFEKKNSIPKPKTFMVSNDTWLHISHVNDRRAKIYVICIFWGLNVINPARFICISCNKKIKEFANSVDRVRYTSSHVSCYRRVSANVKVRNQKLDEARGKVFLTLGERIWQESKQGNSSKDQLMFYLMRASTKQHFRRKTGQNHFKTTSFKH